MSVNAACDLARSVESSNRPTVLVQSPGFFINSNAAECVMHPRVHADRPEGADLGAVLRRNFCEGAFNRLGRYIDFFAERFNAVRFPYLTGKIRLIKMLFLKLVQKI